MLPFTTIVLAGGASSRMGEPKALLRFGTETLIERVVDRLAPTANEIVVVSGPHVRLPSLGSRARVIEDSTPLQGPVAGIQYGLQAARNEWSFVCGCDHPFIAPAVARLLVERAGADSGAVAVCDGSPQPLLAAYRKSVAAIAAELLASGERRASRLVEAAGLVEITGDDVLAVDPSGLSLFDVDTPEAYRRALALIAEDPTR